MPPRFFLASNLPETIPYAGNSDYNGYSAQTFRANASTRAQSVNSTTAVGSVGPRVIHMMKRMI